MFASRKNSQTMSVLSYLNFAQFAGVMHSASSYAIPSLAESPTAISFNDLVIHIPESPEIIGL